MCAELAFEYLLAALEAVGLEGTPIDPPTHYLSLAGKVTPKIERYRPKESTGTLAEFHRSKTVRKWSEWEAEGGLDIYKMPLILNALAAGSITVPQHPLNGVVGVLDLYADVADAQTVTIGADVYEFEVVNTDSTVNTAGGSWNNVTDPLTVDLLGMVGLVGVIAEGDLIRIQNEIMKCTTIVGTNHTFARGRSNTTTAVHADALDIYISAAPGVPGTDFLVGLVATLTPAVAAPALAAEINAEDTEGVTATSVTITGAYRAVECLSDTQQAIIVVSETLAGALNAWRSSVATYIWDFAPTMTADDLQAMTFYWGDPNVQAFQAAYNMIDEATFAADTSGTDGVTLALKGTGLFPSKTAPAGVPGLVYAPILIPAAMQLWVDAVTLGSTAVTGRVVSAEVKVPGGIAYKYLAAGPAATLGFSGHGRAKRHVEAKIVFEVPDMTQYDQWVAETVLKVKLRLNGPAIVSVSGPTVHYHYVDFELYGPWDVAEWGENEGTNRTLELTLLTEYDTTATRDWAMRVHSNRSTLT